MNFGLYNHDAGAPRLDEERTDPAQLCLSTEPGTHLEERQHTEIAHEYSQMVRSRTTPIGTPPIPEFGSISICWRKFGRGPTSMLKHRPAATTVSRA